MLLINSSFSSTYGPVIAEARRANVPLWFAGSVPEGDAPAEAGPAAFLLDRF